jgi:hypothetical protein
MCALIHSYYELCAKSYIIEILLFGVLKGDIRSINFTLLKQCNDQRRSPPCRFWAKQWVFFEVKNNEYVSLTFSFKSLTTWYPKLACTWIQRQLWVVNYLIYLRVKYINGPRTCTDVPLRSTISENRNQAPLTCYVVPIRSITPVGAFSPTWHSHRGQTRHVS